MRARANALATTIVLALALAVTVAPLAADDEAAKAAEKAGDAAAAAERAAQAARAAAAAAKAAVETAKKDANAKDSSDGATAAAEKAAAKAADALQRAEEANQAAKDAQAAQQKGDDAAAAAAAAKAGAKADDAKTAADEAAAAAKKADDGRRAADNRLRNDTPPNSGTIRPPTTDEQDDLDSQSGNLDSIGDDAKVKRARARRLAKQASDLLVEEETKNDNQQHKVDEQKPGELPLRVPYDGGGNGGGTFFDVFFNLLPPLHYPNLDAPLMVPEVEGALNNRALLRLLLVNDNPFDVDVTGVEGSFFGGGIDFVGSGVRQTVPANAPLELLLGLVTFVGRPGAYTFADFSIITDDSHPGLGPEFSANFATVPEPSTIVLLVTGAITGTWLRRRRGHGCARGPASTDGVL